MYPTSDEKVVVQHACSPNHQERQYLTGLRLAVVLGSVTLVSFLVLLDMSILGTVSPSCKLTLPPVTYTARQSLE